MSLKDIPTSEPLVFEKISRDGQVNWEVYQVSSPVTIVNTTCQMLNPRMVINRQSFTPTQLQNLRRVALRQTEHDELVMYISQLLR